MHVTFFFFFYRKSSGSYLLHDWKIWFTSEAVSEFIMGGISSIHVTKSSINWPYLANPCTALFPSLQVWRTSNWHNNCM